MARQNQLADHSKSGLEFDIHFVIPTQAGIQFVGWALAHAVFCLHSAKGNL